MAPAPFAAHNGPLYSGSMEDTHRTFWRGSKICCQHCPKTWSSDQEYRTDDEPCAHEERVTQPELAKMLGIKQATLRGYVAREQITEPGGFLRPDRTSPWWYASVAVEIVKARRARRETL